LGTIGTGVWNGAVIAESYGGAGTVNGILKADGNGLVSAASSSDFQVPLTFSSPLTNVSNTISMSQVSSSTSGYLSNTDWNTFNNKLSSSEKAVANGIATLDASGKIPTSQVPAISFSSGYVVNNQTQMLALSSAVVGSIAIRTDNSKNYVLSASDPANINNWLELLMPASVSSVNGYTTGSITLTSSDIAEGTNLYFNNTRVRSAVNGFLSGDAPMSYTTSTGKISITQATTHSNGYLSSTDWNTFNNKQSSMVGGTGVSISGGNTINIGQAVANTNSPSFAGITLSSLNVSGIVANTAAGVLTTVSTTGTGLVVKENTPTLITPNIGAATASSINATGDITAKRYKLTMPTATSAAATTNIDLSTGNVFTINLGANITSLTISNAAVGTYLIKFVQDATGSRTVSFPAAWKWAGGVAPTLTTTASKLDIVTLVYDGTLFYATIVKNF